MSNAGQAWLSFVTLSKEWSRERRSIVYSLDVVYARERELAGTRGRREEDRLDRAGRFLSRICDLAHFVPHSGHTYAVASRTSSKFTAREHAVGTDARLRPCRESRSSVRSAHLRRLAQRSARQERATAIPNRGEQRIETDR